MDSGPPAKSVVFASLVTGQLLAPLTAESRAAFLWAADKKRGFVGEVRLT
jgi:hypothetical protein